MHFKMVVKIMKMSAFGLCEMRSFLVMSLINMDRFDEAYNVIKFWMITFQEKNSPCLGE